MTEPRIRTEDARPLLTGIKSASRGDAPLPHSPSLETIAKIVGRLHREVRYTGIEFGSAKLIPEFPSETLRRHFGDCKDKSTLLVAALRASGIDAYLALLSAGDDQDVSAELPGLGMVGFHYNASMKNAPALRRVSSFIAGVEAALPDTYGHSNIELAKLLNELRARYGAR